MTILEGIVIFLTYQLCYWVGYYMGMRKKETENAAIVAVNRHQTDSDESLDLTDGSEAKKPVVSDFCKGCFKFRGASNPCVVLHETNEPLQYPGDIKRGECVFYFKRNFF